jgi:pantetheine-phosphate adenylyltransferase
MVISSKNLCLKGTINKDREASHGSWEDIMEKFRSVAVGGTFDEFHKGHRALLMKAFEVGDHVLLGLSSDELVKKLKKPHRVSPYSERLKDLESFLNEKGLQDRVEIVTLKDPYGVTLSKGCIEAIVVSTDSAPKAHEINEKRKAKRLPPLSVVVVELVASENSFPISTTQIRRGKIDREGHLLKSHS